MGCGCNKGSAAAQPSKTVIKYEFGTQQYASRADADAARNKAGGSGVIRTVAVRA